MKKAPALLRRIRLPYQRAGAGLVGNGVASRGKADAPTKPPPTRQKICRQISEGAASLATGRQSTLQRLSAGCRPPGRNFSPLSEPRALLGGPSTDFVTRGRSRGLAT